ncbi:hypothetical protein [Propionicimonas sp.]|uniref:hypothetical protein n=1 Tax=Propionicimonas sp. TaxID=1955623 RepID=UPI00182A45DF|nr:hypothetical protein [Propionicimonas sp.]MBU3976435.1 hypothetical protein [Actinomycetota bacterium]MBA3020275.1 hypothetical protein [Propionicimonas sp.]MBU3986062.1 hypothetical protein [Actinomycetota bacterium]MBU4007579.1 hypothetical protein [Actinomycetota bacterium]MBU4064360.1 hypothetical protein [Actinomycetota bacterium]
MAALKNLVGGDYVEAINAALACLPAAQTLLGHEAAIGLPGGNGYFHHHSQALASVHGSNT